MPLAKYVKSAFIVSGESCVATLSILTIALIVPTSELTPLNWASMTFEFVVGLPVGVEVGLDVGEEVGDAVGLPDGISVGVGDGVVPTIKLKATLVGVSKTSSEVEWVMILESTGSNVRLSDPVLWFVKLKVPRFVNAALVV